MGKKLQVKDSYKINSYAFEPNVIWNYGSKYRIMFNFIAAEQ